MVVERGHPEEPLALPRLPLRVLEVARLEDHGERLDEEDGAEDGEQQLLLDHHRGRPDRRAEREAPGIAHEDLRGVAVVPEEPEARRRHRRGEDHELVRATDEDVVDEVGGDGVARDVDERDEPERDERARPRREPVEAVGEVDRVRERGDDEHHDGDVDQPADVHAEERAEEVVVDRAVGDEREARERGLVVVGREEVEHDPDEEPERDLPDDLGLLGEPLLVLLHDLDVVVGEPDGAHPERREHGEEDVGVGEVGPEQRAPAEREDDDDAAHRGRARLVLVADGAGVLALADLLAELAGAEELDDPLAREERDDQRRPGRERGADRGEGEDLEARRLERRF